MKDYDKLLAKVDNAINELLEIKLELNKLVDEQQDEMEDIARTSLGEEFLKIKELSDKLDRTMYGK
jgi:hypothetical protein